MHLVKPMVLVNLTFQTLKPLVGFILDETRFTSKYQYTDRKTLIQQEQIVTYKIVS